jgi:hypothetical protein
MKMTTWAMAVSHAASVEDLGRTARIEHGDLTQERAVPVHASGRKGHAFQDDGIVGEPFAVTVEPFGRDA